uniref:Carboxylic ester hydrolase n=1 Tax=Strongyloides venezuelensis TaxID=75913 RepID=A0A0K0G1C9_STRVS
MIQIFLLLISFFHITFCKKVSSSATTAKPPDVIHTTIGDMTGHKLTFAEGSVTEYLGIPFAYPPYGTGRFLPPTPINKKQWNDTREFSTIANSCMQVFINDSFEGYNFTNPKKNISEDCLQLNMWVPEHKDGSTIVFLFGDSFLYGSPSLDFNNGSVLALKSKAIIVNLNYRLSIFGFAYFGEDSWVKGNMGLLDQQVGLKWVHDNIKYFGGDENKITLYGSSAGATSVTAHLFSKNSSNLFNRAIVSSGAITNLWTTSNQEEAYNHSMNVARLLNCTEDKRSEGENKRILELMQKANSNESITLDRIDNKTKIILCLQNKTTEEILTVVNGIYNETFHGTYNKDKDTYSIEAPQIYPFVPIDNDTVFFEKLLWDKYKNKEFSNKVDIIFGRTQDDLAYLMPFTLLNPNCTFNSTLQEETHEEKKKDDRKNRCLLNETDLESAAELIGGVMKFSGKFPKKLAELYKDTNKHVKQDRRARSQVAKMMSEFFIHCNLSQFADDYYKATKSDNKKVYLYEYRKRSVINPWPKWMGPMHTWELEPLFGYPIRHPELYESKLEEKIAGKQTQTTTTAPNVTYEQFFSNISMIQIGNFSKSGVPGKDWRQLNGTNKLGLVISGNLSGVNYTDIIVDRCKKLTTLIDEYKKKTKEQMEQEKQELEAEKKKKDRRNSRRKKRKI